MAQTLANGETDIVNRLKTVPGIDVIEGEYTQDSWTPTVDANEMFVPYALIKFNGALPTLDNGIVGPEQDTLRSTFSIFVVSPDDRTTRVLRDQIRAKMLTDFQPTDSSSLRPTGGYSFVDSDLGYSRYVHNIGFSYVTNLAN